MWQFQGWNKKIKKEANEEYVVRATPFHSGILLKIIELAAYI